MDSVLSVLESIGRYLRLIRLHDVLDVAIIAFAVYKLIPLIKRTRAGNLIKGVIVFMAALGLSYLLKLQAVNYVLSHILEIGVLALVI